MVTAGDVHLYELTGKVISCEGEGDQCQAREQHSLAGFRTRQAQARLLLLSPALFDVELWKGGRHHGAAVTPLRK